jgi:hypothetical protein
MNGRADSPNHWMDAESIIFLLVIDDWLKETFASRMESWEEGLGRLRTRSSPVMTDSEKAKLLYKANLFEEKRAKCRNDRSFGLNVVKL